MFLSLQSIVREGAFEVHLLSCDGMLEGYFRCMEHQSLAFGAVEFVADDGPPQSVGMGAMDAELMGASAGRIEFDASG